MFEQWGSQLEYTRTHAGTGMRWGSAALNSGALQKKAVLIPHKIRVHVEYRNAATPRGLTGVTGGEMGANELPPNSRSEHLGVRHLAQRPLGSALKASPLLPPGSRSSFLASNLSSPSPAPPLTEPPRLIRADNSLVKRVFLPPSLLPHVLDSASVIVEL